MVAPAGYFVVVTFHPHFIMSSGMPTHFTAADGEEVAIVTNVHLAISAAYVWRTADAT